MTSQIHKNLEEHHRRAYFLLKLIVFYYPIPDAGEVDYLMAKASEWQAEADRKWATDFVEKEPTTAFQRLKDWLGTILIPMSVDDRADFFSRVWQADERLPHVTEMQGTALMRLTQEWDLHETLLNLLGKRAK